MADVQILMPSDAEFGAHGFDLPSNAIFGPGENQFTISSDAELAGTLELASDAFFAPAEYVPPVVRSNDCFDSERDCPCTDNPLANLSAEAPDFEQYISTRRFTPRGPVPLGYQFRNQGCASLCVAPTQQAADLCASQQAAECAYATWTKPAVPGGGGGNPPIPPATCITSPNSPACKKDPIIYTPVQVFTNQAQTCEAQCGDGSVYTAMVASGTFSALSQSAANALARAHACRVAQIQKLCFFTDELAAACAGNPYLEFIIATGGTQGNPCEYTFSIIAGALPDGLSLNSCNGDISGTPITGGGYGFTIQVEDASGNKQTKDFTIVVMEITTTALDPGSIGGNYFDQLLQLGIEPSEAQWAIASGALPRGIEMSTDGTLSGVAFQDGTFPITFRLTDPESGATCTKDLSIFIDTITITPNILNATPISFGVIQPGNYQIEYVAGAMQYSASLDWFLNIVFMDRGFYVIRGGGANFRFPGSTMAFPSQAAVEFSNAGASVQFSHSGGEVKMFLEDGADYGDNLPGSPNPTFRLAGQ